MEASKALQVKEDASLTNVSFEKGIVVRDLDQVVRLANVVHQSGLAPKDFNTPQKVAIGIMMNMEIGRPLITGLQDLAVINGRCGIYGNGALALITASGEMEEDYPKEDETGTPFEDDWTFTYTVKRKGRPEKTGKWTWLDAKRAGKAEPKTRDGKPDRWSPWALYPRRMMQWKSRSWVLKDEFGDVLKGLNTAEELHDIVELEAQPNGSFGLDDLKQKIEESTGDPLEIEKEEEPVTTVTDSEKEQPKSRLDELTEVERDVADMFWRLRGSGFAKNYKAFCDEYPNWTEDVQKLFAEKCDSMTTATAKYSVPEVLELATEDAISSREPTTEEGTTSDATEDNSSESGEFKAAGMFQVNDVLAQIRNAGLDEFDFQQYAFEGTNAIKPDPEQGRNSWRYAKDFIEGFLDEPEECMAEFTKWLGR